MLESSEGVALLWRVDWYAIVEGGVVRFASDEGRVLVVEVLECEVDGGVVGVVGQDGCRGMGLRDT